MRWDLDQLMVGLPARGHLVRERLDLDLKGFEDRYRGKVMGMGAEDLSLLIQDRDRLCTRYEPFLLYCRLRRSQDALDQEAAALHELQLTAKSSMALSLSFVDVELGRLLASQRQLLEAPSLSEYRHYLERSADAARHLLSEAEERMVARKDRHGVERWAQLYGDWLGRLRVRLQTKEDEYLSLGELEAWLWDPDRDRRSMAWRALGRALGESEPLWAEALAAICADHVEMCRARGYGSPMAPSLAQNDVGQDTIEAMMGCLEGNLGLAREYYATKAKLLDLEVLADCDLMAPLPDGEGGRYDARQAQGLVSSAFASFDPEWGDWVEAMFDRGFVDLEVRPGKEPGASCEEWLGGRSAFVSLNFHGRTLDLFQLAHELGHAVHAHCYSRAQGPVNCRIGSCLAESASAFAELLLAKHLMDRARGSARKAALCCLLDNIAFTMLQIPARVRFETGIYSSLESGRGTGPEQAADLWEEAMRHYHGGAVEMLPESRHLWALSSGYFEPHSRYHSYPYVFGELFALSLLRAHGHEGTGDKGGVRRLLEAGSSRSVEGLADEMGFDIGRRSFWQAGLDRAQEFLMDLERTL